LNPSDSVRDRLKPYLAILNMRNEAAALLHSNLISNVGRDYDASIGSHRDMITSHSEPPFDIHKNYVACK
jgi:hypothetical protein